MDSHDWTNVQGPVRDMILTIMHTIREQSSDMARILTTLDNYMPRDVCLKKLYTREEGEGLESSKATVNVVRALEAKLEHANKQIAKLAQVVDYQTTAITDLNSRLERAQHQVDLHNGKLLHPDYDEIYAYVDRVESNIRRDTQQGFANFRPSGTPAPVSTEFMSEINKLKEICSARNTDVDSRILKHKDDIEYALKSVQEAIRVQIHDIQSQHLSNISSIETAAKSLSAELAENKIKVNTMELTVKGLNAHTQTIVDSAERRLDAKIKQCNAEVASSKTSQLHAHDVRSIVNQTLQERQYGDVTKSMLNQALLDLSSSLRTEATKEQDILKREMNLQQTQNVRDWQTQIQNRVESIVNANESARRDLQTEQNRIRELSDELTRSLSKKANQSDLRALVRGVSSSGESTKSDVLHDLQESILDIRADSARAKKASETELSNLRAILHEKMDTAKVEQKVVDLLEVITGRSVSRITSEQHESMRYNWQGTFNMPPPPNAEWKLAIGELGLALRRELETKISKDDCTTLIREETKENHLLLKNIRKELDHKAEHNDFSKVMNSVEFLSSRVVSELTGALWLWTSRQLSGLGGDTCIPWDVQVINAAPSSLLWRKGSTDITVKLPGLYRIGLAVFTNLPVSLTVCLNDEPLLVLGPEATPDRLSSFANIHALREEHYILRRLRHSAGDTTAVSLDEPISLPANAVISIRYQSVTASQAYLSLRKL